MKISVGIESILTGENNLQYLQVLYKISVDIGPNIDIIFAGEDTQSHCVAE